MPTTQARRISADQYRALQRPVVVLPNPQQLFDQIVETLVAKELAKYEHADPFRSSISNGLFNLIPPRPEGLDFDYLTSLIEVNGKKGTNYIYPNPKEFTDTVAVPVGPYLVLDVEDGKGRLNTKPSVAEANILAEHRSPYTVFEGIIHGIVFPEVFASHNMYLGGSRYGSRMKMPYLYLTRDVLELCATFYDDAIPEWGAPSCGSRVGA